MEPSLNRLKAICYHDKILGIPLSEAVDHYLDIAYYHDNNALSSKVNWSLMDHVISDETMKSAGYFDHGFLPGAAHYFLRCRKRERRPVRN